MTTIRFHRVDNIDYPRYHGTWFKKFAKYCEQYFTVEWVNYAKTSSQGISTIEMQTPIGSFGKTPPLSDVDCVIENLDTNEYVFLSFTEFFNSFAVHYLRSNLCKHMCLSHFNYHNLYYWLKKDGLVDKIDKVSPWFFGSYTEYDVNFYRNLRHTTNQLNDQLFYKGSGYGSYRKVIDILHHREVLNGQSVPFNDYLAQLAVTKCALSYYMDLDKYYTPYDYVGEFCYRDMEYMALGVPFIRIEYKDSVHQGLFPNHHYISIPREYAYDAYNKYGNEGVASLIQEKHQEVLTDESLLHHVSNNQITWFDNYAKWPNSANLTINLTGILEWI